MARRREDVMEGLRRANILETIYVITNTLERSGKFRWSHCKFINNCRIQLVVCMGIIVIKVAKHLILLGVTV